MRTALGTAGTALLVVLSSRTVLADGAVFNTGGTKALARGGAVAARLDDPMALHHGPAGLANVEGKQLLGSVSVGIQTACVRPYGYYGWGVVQPGVSEFGDTGQVAQDSNGNALPGQYATRPLDEMCDTAPPSAIPQLVFSWRLAEHLGVAFGFVGPDTLGNTQWGGTDGTIERDGKTLPSPTRYQLVSQTIYFALNPTVGVGYRLLPGLDIGAAFQWLALGIEHVAVQSQASGTSPDADMLVKTRAADYFIPSLTLSVHAQPLEQLDLTLAFQVRDDFDGSGEATFTTGAYAADPVSPGVPHENPPMKLDRVTNALPWTLTAGARWAEPLGDRPQQGELHDAMGTEQWDVEIDVGLLLNQRFSATTASVADQCERDASGARIPDSGTHNRGCQTLDFTSLDPSGAAILDRVDVPPEGVGEISTDRHYKNQLAVRLGGSYSIVPKRLQLMAGGYYETRGVDPDYASIDAMPFARIGVGTGVVVRIGSLDLMAAYGHIFQETLDVAAPLHQPRDQANPADPHSGFDKRVGQPCALGDPACVDPQPLSEAGRPANPDGTAALQQSSLLQQKDAQSRVVNAGIYRADIDAVSIGAILHF